MIPERADYFATLRAKTPTDVALDVFAAIDEMNPIEIPPLPGLSNELWDLLKKRAPKCPELLEPEHTTYCNAIKQRANARGENVRRLRTLLWAEALLRAKGYHEHEVLRAFNRDVWAVPDAASDDYAIREYQLSRQ